MQGHDDKIISQKINLLDETDFETMPNLESKWSVLEAGLYPQKRKGVITFLHIGIAASLILCGLGIWLMYQNYNVTSHQTAVNTVLGNGSKKNRVEKIAPIVKSDTIKLKGLHSKQVNIKMVKAPVFVEPKKEYIDSILPITVTKPIENIAIVEPKQTIKKQRYTEIDFDAPLVKNQTLLEPVMAAQPVRFGFGVMNKTGADEPTESNKLRFAKVISN